MSAVQDAGISSNGQGSATFAPVPPPVASAPVKQPLNFALCMMLIARRPTEFCSSSEQRGYTSCVLLSILGMLGHAGTICSPSLDEDIDRLQKQRILCPNRVLAFGLSPPRRICTSCDHSSGFA